MKVLTEADLRTEQISRADREYRVPQGTFVTPSAKEFLRDRGVELIFDCVNPSSHAAMTRTPIKKQGGRTYIDAATGEGYGEKPEDMTHLRGNLLVPKTHPRIELRGRIDGLQARVLLMQAKNQDNRELCRELDSVLQYLREILGAEVKEEPLSEVRLFGLEHSEIRRMSHNVKEYFGIEHPIPDCTMGETALELNLLRTQVREAELSAANAFPQGDPLGIIEHLNRLSSGIYILFCRVVSGLH
ncbi:hypothetical protein V3C10_02235 [[Clostridium] symbiosum]|uniref:hypothetical protein n=1 Tax=Clostridium symbiosum TaxID=1512 RepID=UPI001D06C64C|nr:hypothetical protein [[Clostridium] symbiosum]MCB6608563.1 hypothetical protein [[Clostridium] symbiosum]MCB6932125.1 hypothetical protein [[Clostridium] symbiosum]